MSSTGPAGRSRIRLGTADLGRRVVVRRFDPVATAASPAGRPLFRDLLGELEFLDADRLVVRLDNGQAVTVTRGDIAAAKVVPPRLHHRGDD